VFFIVAFYFYFKQYYEKLIVAKIDHIPEQRIWKSKLKKKLLIFPAGIIAIFLLYAISYVLINRYPDVENVKSSRRAVDVVATVMCLAVFIFDKRELDKRLYTKKKAEQPLDKSEPGIDIPEPEDTI
jgi:hypothetical protein